MDDDDLIAIALLGLIWWYFSTPAAGPGPALAASPAARASAPAISSSGCSSVHPQFTGLDDASMFAAVTASFRGIYGRDPTGQAGAGPDDIGYWVGVSNHQGTFTGGACAAGWNAYWEMKLAGNDSVNPALLDQPAVFQP